MGIDRTSTQNPPEIKTGEDGSNAAEELNESDLGKVNGGTQFILIGLGRQGNTPQENENK